MKTNLTKLLVQFLSDKERDLPSVGQSWTLLSPSSCLGGLATRLLHVHVPGGASKVQVPQILGLVIEDMCAMTIQLYM